MNPHVVQPHSKHDTSCPTRGTFPGGPLQTTLVRRRHHKQGVIPTEGRHQMDGVRQPKAVIKRKASSRPEPFFRRREGSRAQRTNSAVGRGCRPRTSGMKNSEPTGRSQNVFHSACPRKISFL